MKNLVMGFVVLFTAVFANAQVSFDIHAGVSLSSISEDDAEDGSKEKILPGMVAGAHVYIPAGRIGFITGIDLRQKGKVYEYHDDVINYSEKVTFSSYYLEVPAHVQLFFSKKGTTGFYALAGGYMGFGIGGKIKYKADGETEDDSISWGGDDDEVAPFDAGLSAGLGYKFKKGLFMQTVYNHGLMNITNDDDYKAQHRGLALSIGWRFGTSGTK